MTHSQSAAEAVCDQFGGMDHYRADLAHVIDPHVQEAVAEAILAEREACALVADALAAQWQDEGAIQGACIAADAIRARGKR